MENMRVVCGPRTQLPEEWYGVRLGSAQEDTDRQRSAALLTDGSRPSLPELGTDLVAASATWCKQNAVTRSAMATATVACSPTNYQCWRWLE